MTQFRRSPAGEIWYSDWAGTWWRVMDTARVTIERNEP